MNKKQLKAKLMLTKRALKSITEQFESSQKPLQEKVLQIDAMMDKIESLWAEPLPYTELVKLCERKITDHE